MFRISVVFSPERIAYRSEELRTFLPFLLLRARIARPFLVELRSRKPCLLTFFLFDGWNVRFMFPSFVLMWLARSGLNGSYMFP